MNHWESSSVRRYYPSQEHDHDFIGGEVGGVIDGNTFELFVTEEDPDNLYTYQLIEVVKIVGRSPLPQHSTEELEAMDTLVEEIEGKDVVCEVVGRDNYGNILAIYNLS